MNAQQQRLEVEPGGADDDDLAIDDAARGQRGGEGGDELREVPVHGFFVAALQEELVAVAKYDRPEAVPLGLELPARPVRQGVRRARQHGRQRWSERQAHARILRGPYLVCRLL